MALTPEQGRQPVPECTCRTVKNGRCSWQGRRAQRVGQHDFLQLAGRLSFYQLSWCQVLEAGRIAPAAAGRLEAAVQATPEGHCCRGCSVSPLPPPREARPIARMLSLPSGVSGRRGLQSIASRVWLGIPAGVTASATTTASDPKRTFSHHPSAGHWSWKGEAGGSGCTSP